MNRRIIFNCRSIGFAGIVLLISIQEVMANVSLPSVFTDNMVLQQQSDVPLWGKADAGEEITVATSWNGQQYDVTTGSDGKWMVSVTTPGAGFTPYEISIKGKNMILLKNILIGEVWVCSGQSNMEMPLGGWGKVLNYEQEIAEASFPSIRLLRVANNSANQPQQEAKLEGNGWVECSPATIPEFSSVAYFFGRDLLKSRNFPVGLIDTNWGGTVAEAWTSASSLKLMPDFAEAVRRIESASEEESVNQDPAGNPNRPSVLYNAMINPIVPFTIRGAIWYQGESNADRAVQYRDLFPLMISDWRRQWGEEFDFYFVQLASFMAREAEPAESAWAELREAQTMTLHLDNTGMAVTTDIGDAVDIHPKNKQEVGRRLALIARAKSYREKIGYSGPLYRNYQVEGDEIRLCFDFNEALKSSDGKGLRGFAIAGPDRKFYWAEAVIDGDEIVVSSPKVSHPLAVRYGWANNPDCNLSNQTGLPASPFRTDQWAGVTK